MFRPDGLNNPLLSQGGMTETAPFVSMVSSNIHSKNGGRREEPPIPQVLLNGQLAAMSSQWPPPTEVQSLIQGQSS